MKYTVRVWRVIEQVWEVEADSCEDAEILWDEGKLLTETIDPDDGDTFQSVVEEWE